ncbi:MAG: enoyl-CoA hydratase/isomerase family protein [Alphaproteobacteria bacterium]|nr:MAG: enoyl-CoA hydratase/isomerase family protein [Alphaproteobacteria bacterium]
MDDREIIFSVEGGIGHVLLNRPKALNALTHGMCTALHAQLDAWGADDSVEAVVIEGAGEKGFCAGGDIRAIHDSGKAGTDYWRRFFSDEYRLNAAIFHYQKPYIALIDGIVMGGGVGVSEHGTHRIATERTLYAMPETGIGLIPDVGGSYFLPRLPDHLGLYLGLTGARLKAADCIHAGVADAFIPSDRLEAFKAELRATHIADVDDVDRIIEKYKTDPGEASLSQVQDEIARCFAGHTVEEIIEALDESGSEWATRTAKTLATKSPTSLKLTFRQIHEGAGLDFNDGMRMEYRVVSRIMKGNDFYEGVRAVIIDKDNAPKWQPDRLDAVTDEMVDSYFASLGDDELEL